MRRGAVSLVAVATLACTGDPAGPEPPDDAGASAPGDPGEEVESPDPAATDADETADAADADETDADETDDATGPQVRLELVIDGLDVPNDLADLGDGRLLVSDQVGRLHLVVDGAIVGPPVLDLTDRITPPSTNALEMGLSGVAVHPAFDDGGRIFVLFTEPPPAEAEAGIQRVDVLSEFTAGGDPLQVDPGSERVLLRIEQPTREHIGGHMLVGPDGLLYVGLGDAGEPADAQDPASLRGKVIRIDPDEGDPYGIPADNPFATEGGAPEVFATGFRNPFRVAWLDGAGLLVAEPKFTAKDQDVHLVTAGGNYGWPDLPRTLPGRSCYLETAPAEPEPACLLSPEGEPWEPPVIEYGREVGRIVSGVAVFGTDEVPELTGQVIVSDWHGNLLAAPPGTAGERWPTTPLRAVLPDGGPPTAYLWALDSDAAGNVYALTATIGFDPGGGAVYRFAPIE